MAKFFKPTEECLGPIFYIMDYCPKSPGVYLAWGGEGEAYDEHFRYFDGRFWYRPGFSPRDAWIFYLRRMHDPDSIFISIPKYWQGLKFSPDSKEAERFWVEPTG